MSGILKQRIKQSTDFESPAVEAMLNLMVAADHIRTRIDRVCAKFGITHGQYNVLRILRGAHPEGHARCDIAARMVERAPDVTRLVDRLETNGLVERDRAEQDRRLSVTRITEKGLKLIEEMDDEMRGANDDLAESLSPAECLALSRLCEKIYANEK